MVVTPKLANRFYREFGEEMATELVDWLNTMDAESQSKLDRRHDAATERFVTEIRSMSAELRLELRTEMARLEARLAWQLLGIVATLTGVIIGLFLKR